MKLYGVITENGSFEPEKMLLLNFRRKKVATLISRIKSVKKYLFSPKSLCSIYILCDSLTSDLCIFCNIFEQNQNKELLHTSFALSVFSSISDL